MLQAQVHPHFLFNVLSSIRLKLLMKGDEETALVVGSLSSLLRASLSKQDEFAFSTPKSKRPSNIRT
ncbi:sensor histidine kinase [Paenibacillus macerans]|nr:histidine kinase [Paenibacillus macerans]